MATATEPRVTPRTPEEQAQARTALAEVAARFARLVRSTRRPDAVAVGDWNVIDVAAHVSHAFGVIGGLAKGTDSPLKDMWDLGHTTASLVAADHERSPAVLADRVDRAAVEFLNSSAIDEGDDLRPWLVDGSRLPLSSLTCHLLSECLIHGWDIAHAQGLRFDIDPAHAALVVKGFMVPAMQSLDPATFVDPRAGAGVDACFDLRLRGGGRFQFVFAGNRLTVGASPRRADCHLLADPAALFLVAWGRRGLWGALARGQLIAWGRRPWLGLRFKKLIRNP